MFYEDSWKCIKEMFSYLLTDYWKKQKIIITLKIKLLNNKAHKIGDLSHK